MGSRKGRCAGRPDDVFGEGCHGWVRRAKTTPSRCTGVVAAARTQGKRTQHGKPHAWTGMTNRTPARERPGAAWGGGEVRSTAEAGNAGGGKGPQFKTDARRSEGPGDWATYQLRTAFRNCRRRCTRKRRQNPATASTPSTTRSAARTFWRTNVGTCRSDAKGDRQAEDP